MGPFEFTEEVKMELDTLRHSCSHVMAQAVKALWPEVKLAIGPAIEDGFYYDFDKQGPFSDEELLAIEKKMQEIIANNEPFLQENLSKEKAIELFKRLKEDYKVELIQALPGESVSIYKTGKSFLDLCRGPHIKSTGQIKAFKLLSVAGAYWHGIETNPMLQRIYGTCFENKEELDEYLKNLEEARLRDHRKLGPALELFDIYHEEGGAGLVFYHPKGAILRSIIEDYEKQEHLKRGYQLVVTPHIMDVGLWKTSGHYDYYKESMFIIKEEKDAPGVEGAAGKNPTEEFVLKPMNCPGHILIYKSKTRSYKDLPLRLFELGTVYRREKTGVLHGLLRVRGFTQDDAHIFCLAEQLQDEIDRIIDFVFEMMQVFGFDQWQVELSTRPEKYIGPEEDWQKATAALEDALKKKDIAYDTNLGEGAFYGPKIDIKLKDALKRTWQCATIQCDFALPKRFNLSYIDAQGKQRQPVMLHRVLLGSLERFIGALLEHYKGELPLWLSPCQVLLIPINATVIQYAQRVRSKLEDSNIRLDIDMRNETLDKKIRNAELDKIPYCLILGEREARQETVSVRKKGSGNQGAIALDKFIQELTNQIQEHR